MPDVKRSLQTLDRIEPPDVWDDAATREPSPFDVDGSMESPSPTKRIVSAVVALALFGAVAVYSLRAVDRTPVAENTTGPTPTAPAVVRGAWQPMPEGPLAPRYGASAFWVDGRVVIMGGVDGAPCPPAADCALDGRALRDGAAFDPSTGTWSSIARAPIPITYGNGVVLGDTVYLLVDRYPDATAFLSYDLSDDLWNELAAPPGTEIPGCCRLAATDDAIVAYFDSQEHEVSPDHLYDPATQGWRELPLDPLTPSFDRSVVWTGEELLLFGIDSNQVNQIGADPYLYLAAALDPDGGEWRRFPDSHIAGYDPSWFWAAGRAVTPTLGHVGDNGNVGGSGPPYGGMLDPATGIWSDLPPGPRNPHDYGGISVGGGDHVVSWQGAILDVAAGTWFGLPPTPVHVDEGASAVWAGDRLIVWGGYAWERTDPLDPSGTLLGTGWSWLPET